MPETWDPPGPPVAPAIRIQGLAPTATMLGQRLGHHVFFAGDTNGDGVGDLLVTASGSDLRTYVFDGPLPTGVFTVAELSTGQIEIVTQNAARAGDVDNDGYQDVWLQSVFFRGPLNGEHSPYAPDAIILDGLSYTVAAGFDADQDGIPDMALAGSHQNAEIHYGPFSGEIPGYFHADFDEENTSTFAGGCESITGASFISVVEDLPAPNALTFVLGSDTFGDCGQAQYLFDVRGSRGRHVGVDGAFASSLKGGLRGVGDWTADGVLDLGRAGVIAGPFAGEINAFEFAATFDSSIEAYVDDITGDGVAEALVMFVNPEDESRHEYFLVPGGSVGEGLRPDEQPDAAYLGTDGADGFYMGSARRDTGDLDGDGRPDLIMGNEFYADYSGEVRIWLASDLFPDGN